MNLEDAVWLLDQTVDQLTIVKGPHTSWDEYRGSCQLFVDLSRELEKSGMLDDVLGLLENHYSSMSTMYKLLVAEQAETFSRFFDLVLLAAKYRSEGTFLFNTLAVVAASSEEVLQYISQVIEHEELLSLQSGLKSKGFFLRDFSDNDKAREKYKELYNDEPGATIAFDAERMDSRTGRDLLMMTSKSHISRYLGPIGLLGFGEQFDCRLPAYRFEPCSPIVTQIIQEEQDKFCTRLSIVYAAMVDNYRTVLPRDVLPFECVDFL